MYKFFKTTAFTSIMFLAMSFVIVSQKYDYYWKFDEGTGINTSESGKGIKTKTNAQWDINGIKGNALLFNGKDSQTVSESLSIIDGTNKEVSISAWIKPRVGSGYHGIVTQEGIFHFKVTNKELCFTTVHILDHFSKGFDLKVNQWQHVAVTFKPDTPSGIKFYKNGKLINTTNSSRITPGKQPITIGNCAASAAPEFFDGVIDEVQIARRVLSDEQIMALYKSIKEQKNITVE